MNEDHGYTGNYPTGSISFYSYTRYRQQFIVNSAPLGQIVTKMLLGTVRYSGWCNDWRGLSNVADRREPTYVYFKSHLLKNYSSIPRLTELFMVQLTFYIDWLSPVFV